MSNQYNNIQQLILSGELSSAEKIAKQLYELDPKNIKSVKALALVFLLQKRSAEAMAMYIYAEKLAPDDFDIVNNLGATLIMLEEYERCEAYSLRAMELDPKSPLPHLRLGEIYLKSSDYQKSMDCFNEGLSLTGGWEKIIDDDNIKILYLDALIANNQKDQAMEILKQMQNLKFSEQVFYYQATLDAKSLTDKDIDAATVFLNKKFPSLAQKQIKTTPIYFGLGRYYEKKDQAKSEEFYSEGNKISSVVQRYNPLEFQKEVMALEKIFINENFDTTDNKGEGIIFIVGLPRSGTTLMESILSTHPDVQSGGELISLPHLTGNHYRTYFKNINEQDKPDELKLTFEEIGDEYLRKTHFLRKGKKFFIDKLPGNYLSIGFIAKCLPGAKIINMQRNFWDIAISQYKQFYLTNIPYATKFFSIAVQASNYKEMMRFWHKTISPDVFLDVEYERLVNDTQHWSSKVFDFCNIKGNYQEEQRKNFFSRTASKLQVREGIHQKSIDKQEFIDQKEQFFLDMQNQDDFWQSKTLIKSV